MPYPKKIKKDIKLTPEKILYPRREELLEMINEKGTYLPKSVLHADLDKGFLDFVKEDLGMSTEGQKIPVVDILLSTQNWSQFVETWNFQDVDKNVSPPFVTVVRDNNIKFGTNPSTQYTIPVRKLFYYATVPDYDGDRLNVTLYKIPQPVPVDIKYSLKFICNRMRELNQLNKKVLQKFSSRQAYTQIKGHYIPIIWDNITDESVMEVDKRKYFVASYDFTMLGFLIDEEEFEIQPGITRNLQLYEVVDSRRKRKKPIEPNNPDNYDIETTFKVGVNSLSEIFYDRINLNVVKTLNVEEYEIYINDEFYGTDVNLIQINSKDVLKVIIVKNDNTQISTIKFVATLL